MWVRRRVEQVGFSKLTQCHEDGTPMHDKNGQRISPKVVGSDPAPPGGTATKPSWGSEDGWKEDPVWPLPMCCDDEVLEKAVKSNKRRLFSAQLMLWIPYH